jgi:hypothetical protein
MLRFGASVCHAWSGDGKPALDMIDADPRG